MAQSCVLITGKELHPTKEKCFESSIQKAEKALTFPQVYQAKLEIRRINPIARLMLQNRRTKQVIPNKKRYERKKAKREDYKIVKSVE